MESHGKKSRPQCGFFGDVFFLHKKHVGPQTQTGRMLGTKDKKPWEIQLFFWSWT